MAGSDHVTGRQLAAARVLLGIEQQEVAEGSAVSVPTLRRMERTSGPAGGIPNNVAAVRRFLEGKGAEFIPENGGGPGVRLRERQGGEETE